jgi:hypothetical protein
VLSQVEVNLWQGEDFKHTPTSFACVSWPQCDSLDRVVFTQLVSHVSKAKMTDDKKWNTSRMGSFKFWKHPQTQKKQKMTPLKTHYFYKLNSNHPLMTNVSTTTLIDYHKMSC